MNFRVDNFECFSLITGYYATLRCTLGKNKVETHVQNKTTCKM